MMCVYVRACVLVCGCIRVCTAARAAMGAVQLSDSRPARDCHMATITSTCLKVTSVWVELCNEGYALSII